MSVVGEVRTLLLLDPDGWRLDPIDPHRRRWRRYMHDASGVTVFVDDAGVPFDTNAVICPLSWFERWCLRRAFRKHETLRAFNDVTAALKGERRVPRVREQETGG